MILQFNVFADMLLEVLILNTHFIAQSLYWVEIGLLFYKLNLLICRGILTTLLWSFPSYWILTLQRLEIIFLKLKIRERRGLVMARRSNISISCIKRSQILKLKENNNKNKFCNTLFIFLVNIFHPLLRGVSRPVHLGNTTDPQHVIDNIINVSIYGINSRGYHRVVRIREWHLKFFNTIRINSV